MQKDTPFCWGNQPARHPKRCTLTGTVRSQQPDNFSGLNIEVNTIDSPRSRIVFNKSFAPQQWHGRFLLGHRIQVTLRQSSLVELSANLLHP
jgi:hypothetical protein